MEINIIKLTFFAKNSTFYPQFGNKVWITEGIFETFVLWNVLYLGQF